LGPFPTAACLAPRVRRVNTKEEAKCPIEKVGTK
jgi:hypothetical protein